MPLVTPSFFTGELAIPNLDKPDVLPELQWFIAKYEEEFFDKLLGYDLHLELMQALQLDIVPQQWIDLVQGKGRYKGLIIGTSLISNSLNGYKFKNPVVVQFDETSGFISGGSTVIVSDWVGWTPIIEKIGFGTQIPGADYTWDKDYGTWTRLNGTFEPNEKYFVQFTLSQSTDPSVVGGPLRSPIANYIYFKWMANANTQTTGVGETSGKVENSTRVGPEYKMVKAWNDMVHMNRSVYTFLRANDTLYPMRYVIEPSSYRGMAYQNELLQTINTLGI